MSDEPSLRPPSDYGALIRELRSGILSGDTPSLAADAIEALLATRRLHEERDAPTEEEAANQ